jgi:hypothetical protein
MRKLKESAARKMMHGIKSSRIDLKRCINEFWDSVDLRQAVLYHNQRYVSRGSFSWHSAVCLPADQNGLLNG